MFLVIDHLTLKEIIVFFIALHNINKITFEITVNGSVFKSQAGEIGRGFLWDSSRIFFFLTTEITATLK